jgi:hypothetical protein
MSSNKEIRSIGIWGPSQSGKTTYLASLISEMKSNPDKWDLVQLRSQDHDTNIDTKLVPDLRKGLFPAGTDFVDPSELKPYVYHITKRNLLSKKRFSIKILDFPGIWVGLGDSRSKALLEHLAECDGIIAIVDPQKENGGEAVFGHSEKNYDHVISELISEIRSTQEDNTTVPRISFCISKCDLDQNFKYIDNPEEYFKSIIGRAIWGDIKNTFRKKHKVFCISSVGRYLTPSGHEKPNIVFDTAEAIERIPYPDKRNPINLLEPLEWLL